MRKVLKFLGSIECTIIILLLLLLLIVIGTLEQTQIGLYRAQSEYFHAIVSFFPSAGFFSIKIPFPGGALLFGLLLINLLVSFGVRFPKRWKYFGLWICHLGLVALIVGSCITFMLAQEGNISLMPNQASKECIATRETELVLTETTSPNYDNIAIFPMEYLKTNAILVAQEFPFSLKVSSYYNSCIVVPTKSTTQDISSHIFIQSKLHPSTKGTDGIILQLISSETQVVDTAHIVLGNGISFSYENRTFTLLLRKHTIFLPFQITLQEFRVEHYPGTKTPQNFESRVIVQDGEQKQEAIIRMNRPLRYHGYTFYQNSYKEDKGYYTSVLTIVHNPGEVWPYFSCILILIGMLLHFIVKMVGRLPESSQH